ncbi:MAG: hypothetical protein ACHQVK_05355 [Candidatus Paceibacterales bacterium]
MPKVRKINPSVSERISKSQRDDAWLLSRLDYLWSNYFTDVRQVNPVYINFGRYSRFRLGSIRFDPISKKSFITISGMFKDPIVPVEVVDQTIAHELTHYTHGFSSPHTRMHKYPHNGGVIKRELESRGLHHLVKAYAFWVKQYKKSLFS